LHQAGCRFVPAATCQAGALAVLRTLLWRGRHPV